MLDKIRQAFSSTDEFGYTRGDSESYIKNSITNIIILAATLSIMIPVVSSSGRSAVMVVLIASIPITVSLILNIIITKSHRAEMAQIRDKYRGAVEAYDEERKLYD